MEKKKGKGKITLGMLKGKPITSSVPSIAIRFNATAEEIEELYVSDGEQPEAPPPTTASSSNVSDADGSPSRQASTPKFAKRSTSIDVVAASGATGGEATAPSDPWRFLSDIRGKITKSVEGRLTEYKTRTGGDGESGSPKASKPIREGGKESSSLSDSEELSESSISKTCGIVSTTEGAEMSSDDETPSLSEKEKKADVEPPEPASTLRKRYKVIKDAETKNEGTVAVGFLENLRNINMGIDEGVENEVESGIDALSQIENITVDGDEVVIREVSGNEVRECYSAESTVFAPTGFVDMRVRPSQTTWFHTFQSFRVPIALAVCLLLYFTLPLSSYVYGFIMGGATALAGGYVYVMVFLNFAPPSPAPQHSPEIFEVPAVKEHHAPTKYEGWVNEYPDKYDPLSYHISQTQSVYLRLQGNLLKVSHSKGKIPKRAMWNEPEHKLTFTRHRIYNLLDAEITLLPMGLTKIRHWSKKYPICVTLNADQLNCDYRERKRKNVVDDADLSPPKRPTKSKKHEEPQIYSRLVDEGRHDETFSDVAGENDDTVSDGRDAPATTNNAMDSDNDLDDSNLLLDCTGEEDENSTLDDWMNCKDDDSSSANAKTSLYIFARTDRQKEHWFRRLKAATHKLSCSSPDIAVHRCVSETIKDNHHMLNEYLKFMSKFFQSNNDVDGSAAFKPTDNGGTPPKNDGGAAKEDISWTNALLSRLVFDLMRNDGFKRKMMERVQRKLSAVKLPYFIEELTLVELTLGGNAPVVERIDKPTMDEWGLWTNFHISYAGYVTIILQTKLNLMKLKQPPTAEKKNNVRSPIFHSDVDDSAESSSDEESMANAPASSSTAAPAAHPVSAGLDSTGNPLPGIGGTSNRGKRLIRMVDRIAESKIFQAATENKYIKKAIEGVSNTDLGLKVEVKSLDGCLVVNVPTPPSDRIWLGFRPLPKLQMSAQPCVGAKNINFLHVTNWIEKILYKEFQKFLVIPNMEDLQIPVMIQTLPE